MKAESKQWLFIFNCPPIVWIWCRPLNKTMLILANCGNNRRFQYILTSSAAFHGCFSLQSFSWSLRILMINLDTLRESNRKQKISNDRISKDIQPYHNRRFRLVNLQYSISNFSIICAATNSFPVFRKVFLLEENLGVNIFTPFCMSSNVWWIVIDVNKICTLKKKTLWPLFIDGVELPQG